MAFKNIHIIGDNTNKTAIVNSELTEAVVHGFVAYNTTDLTQEFSLILNGVEIIKEAIPARDSYRLKDKVNVQSNSVLMVHTFEGVSINISYFQQAVDAVSVLTVAQEYINDFAISVETIKTNIENINIDAENIDSINAVAEAIPNLQLISSNLTSLLQILTMEIAHVYTEQEFVGYLGQLNFDFEYQNSNFVTVHYNGRLLSKIDWNAVNGNSIILTEPVTTEGDLIFIKQWNSIKLLDLETDVEIGTY